MEHTTNHVSRTREIILVAEEAITIAIQGITIETIGAEAGPTIIITGEVVDLGVDSRGAAVTEITETVATTEVVHATAAGRTAAAESANRRRSR